MSNWQTPRSKRQKRRGRRRPRVGRVPGLERSPTSHSLHNEYCFWYYDPSVDGTYEDGLSRVSTINSVEQFWAVYTRILRPRDITVPKTEIHLFKDKIRPLWEDPSNREGGKWVLRVKKEFSSILWEKLLVAVIGEAFDVGKEICGVVVSIREEYDTISVWNHSASHRQAKENIRTKLHEVLLLPEGTELDYRRHVKAPRSKKRRRGNRGRGRETTPVVDTTSSSSVDTLSEEDQESLVTSEEDLEGEEGEVGDSS